ncbi:MAG: hypothetical protein ACOYMC_13750 [Pirellulales bacterium]|jgi:ketol-acid reductoisomerase
MPARAEGRAGGAAKAIREIIREIERGEFARDWMQEWALGMPMLHRLRRTAAAGEMEQADRQWRQEFGT